MATCHLSDWQQKGELVINMVTAWGWNSSPRWQDSGPTLRGAATGQTVQAPRHAHYKKFGACSPGLACSEQWATSSTPRKRRRGQEPPDQVAGEMGRGREALSGDGAARYRLGTLTYQSTFLIYITYSIKHYVYTIYSYITIFNMLK